MSKAEKLPVLNFTDLPLSQKDFILDIKNQTKHPWVKDTKATLNLIINTVVTNIIKMPFCNKNRRSANIFLYLTQHIIFTFVLKHTALYCVNISTTYHAKPIAIR